MRKLIAALALALGLATTATTADAHWSKGEDLRFVAQTSIPYQGGGTMALCHFVDYMDVFFVPVYTTLKGYALSGTGCRGDMYRSLTPTEFTIMQTSGDISADLPAKPAVGLGKLAWNHAWLILGAVGILKTAFSALRGGKRRKSGSVDHLAVHSLVAMSQVAIADGRIDDAEVRQMANVLTRLTGKGFAPEQIMEMLSQLNPTADDLAQVGASLSEKDRQIVLEAALNIAVADGEIHPNEYAVVSELAQRMLIGADQFRSTLARISAQLRMVQPV